MSYYMIAVLTKQDADLYRQYVQGAAGSLAGVSVKPLAVGVVPDVVEGDSEPNVATLLEFADEAAFRTWWNSDAYHAIKHLREKSCVTNLVFGLDGAVNI
jgi:uncharacterized protein (DUF1330 family)